MLKDHVKKLSAQQELLYASNSYAVLMIFQAMDAAGKDGVIAHVMSGVNPQGCDVHSFKHPSATELKHDFLWRTTRPSGARQDRNLQPLLLRGSADRTRAPEILRAKDIPGARTTTKSFWDERYHSIRGLERHLDRNGTRVLKFFLHLSKEEQRKRFIARIDDPEKNWKFSEADIQERKYWKDYTKAYEKCLSATSTKHAPWYVVPADDKLNARLIVSQIRARDLRRSEAQISEIARRAPAGALKLRKQLEK